MPRLELCEHCQMPIDADAEKFVQWGTVLMHADCYKEMRLQESNRVPAPKGLDG